MEWIKNNTIFNFVKYNRYSFFFSLLLILASLGLIFGKGFSYGVDFAGGTLVQIKYNSPAPLSQIRSLLEGD